jgi:peptide/nickel transport system substrate-binding protein
MDRQVLFSRRGALGLVATGAASLVLSACGEFPAPSQSLASTQPTQGASSPPRTGGTLRVASPLDVPNLNGHLLDSFAEATTWNTQDTLIAYDDKRQPQPMLAESWELSPDAKQITLKLRQGVQFHTGRELTSDDVKYNLLRTRDLTIAGPYLGYMSNWFTDIQTPDKYTIVVMSEQPRPLVFDFLEYLNIIDSETAEGPNASAKLVGTGPFALDEWAPGDHMRLVKNRSYWQAGRPYLDEVLVNIVKDPQAIVTQLEAGAVDVALFPSARDMARLQQDPSYQVSIPTANGTIFLIGADTSKPPTDNKLVRQALNYAIDRQRFADVTLLGMSKPADLPWPTQSPAYEPAKTDHYAFDLDRARLLLMQAGVPNLELDLSYSNAAPELADLAQMYQADLAQIGVKLNVKQLEQSVMADQVYAKKHFSGLAAGNGSFANIDPSLLLSLSVWFNHNDNFESFKSDQYSGLVDSAIVEPDAEKRGQLYTQLNDLLLDESFAMALSPQPRGIIATSRAQGFLWRINVSLLYTNVALVGSTPS